MIVRGQDHDVSDVSKKLGFMSPLEARQAYAIQKAA
jgi:hypothetical protein